MGALSPPVYSSVGALSPPVYVLSTAVHFMEVSPSGTTVEEHESVFPDDDEGSVQSSLLSVPRTATSNGSNEDSLNSGPPKKQIQKLTALVNRYKTDNAVLKERLKDLRGVDIDRLQDKLRGSALDLQTVRGRNVELKDRVQVLEAQLHEALSSSSSSSSSSGSGSGGSSAESGGEYGRRLPRSVGSERDEDGYSDALPPKSLARERERGSRDKDRDKERERERAERERTEAELLQLRRTVKALEAKIASVPVASAGGQPSSSAATASLALGPAARASPKPPPFSSTLQTLLPSSEPAVHKAVTAALHAWIDYETGLVKETDRKVIRGLLEEVRRAAASAGKNEGEGEGEGGGGDGGEAAEGADKEESAPRKTSAATTRSPPSTIPRRRDDGYGVGQLILSFLLGVLLVLCSEGVFKKGKVLGI